MTRPSAEFVVSTEQECLTAVEGTDELQRIAKALGRFLEIMRRLAPSLPCPSHGFFNPYGRVYVDYGGHLEMAAVEDSCPYSLVLINARQQELASRAVAQMAEEGCLFVLANNNHSGLLQPGAAIWGAHENYLVERHPSQFGELILPFLVSRVFAGAGGVEHPTGSFLAGVRHHFMELPDGGSTTEQRAIHSTARDENHMGPHPSRFRYHLIVGDGHRSHFNLALQFGATALALKAIFFDEEIRSELAKFRQKLPIRDCWVQTIKELNLLAKPGKEPRAHPLALEIQRAYLAGARRYADGLDGNAPAWIPRVLNDWDETLGALERGDREWLAARLDAFAKYEFFSAVLEDTGCGWKDLRGNKERFFELALLDQSYHEFCNPDSVFTRLEEARLLEHRVGTSVGPGEEKEPHIPETGTRAQARARFIVENAHRKGLLMDWSWVTNLETGTRKALWDPFATAYETPKPRRRAASAG